MGLETEITWTNDTWNPFQGCHKVSAACKNCYMYRDKKRYGQDASTVIRSKPATFNSPLKKLKGPFVFTCSWSDFFIEEADPWREDAWDIIRRTPQLTYQVLTKRPQRIKECLPEDWGNGWKNVWLGVTVENNDELRRVNELSKIPAEIRFISAEPLLENLDLEIDPMVNIDWVITGGESGPGWRQSDPDWFRNVRDWCNDNSVPFFHKQNGGTKKENGVAGGHLLDGKIWSQFPNV